MLLWAGFFITGLELFRKHNRRGFEFLVGVTLLSQMVLQAAINVAVVTSMLPTKGISHPLISYGGSNLVINLVAIGIVVSLSKSSSIVNENESQTALVEHRHAPHITAPVSHQPVA